MSKITLTIIFIGALATTTYFIGQLMTWMVTKIAPQNCKKPFLEKDKHKANLVMVLSIILWSIVFYNLI